MVALKKNIRYVTHSQRTVSQVSAEIRAGLKLLKSIKQPIVTFFGSHLVKTNERDYRHARKTAQALGRAGYTIMSGGGPGIMEAANRGAMDVGAGSIGMQAKLLRQEVVRRNIFTKKIGFNYIFVRRFIMSIKSEALIFYPGGYGTLNELFEFLVLIQTGIADRVPIICVNRKFWRDLFVWIKRYPMGWGLFTKSRDFNLLIFVDTEAEVMKALKSVKKK